MRISRIKVYHLNLELTAPYWLSGGRLKFESLDSTSSRKQKFMLIVQLVKHTEDVLRKRYLLYANYRQDNPEAKQDAREVDPVFHATEAYTSLAAKHLELDRNKARFLLTHILGFAVRNYLVFGDMDFDDHAELLFKTLFPDED